MFFKTIKYLLKTPLKGIRSDVRHYKDLVGLYYKSIRICKMYRRRLVNNLGETADDVCDLYPGCFVTCVKLSVDPRDGDIFPTFYSKTCEHFNDKVPCQETGCSFSKRNSAYFNALNESDKIKDLKKKFWENKISFVR